MSSRGKAQGKKANSDLERRFIMKTTRIRILAVVAVGLLAVGTSVSPAAAQGISAFEGKFTLQSEVRWQDRVLPAGDYSFSINSVTSPAQIVLRGPDGAQILLSTSRSDGHTGQQSSLTIERRGDSSYVRELYLAPLGVHFRYRAPEIPAEKLLAQGPATIERVLISTVGK
jgi:hypothetical protein